MEGLLQIERKIARVEGWVLGAALICMLSLAVYGIAYRNAVVPLVSWLQESAAAPPAGEDESAEKAGAAPAPAPAAAPAAAPAPADEPESDFDSDFGDADDADKKPAVAEPEAESDFDSDFGGDDDNKPPAGGDTESDFDSDFGGGDDAKPAAAAAKAPPPPPAEAFFKEDSGLVKFLLWFNFDWLDIVLRHLILWLAFLGGALATQRRKHIAIDALARRLPASWRPPISLLVSVVSLVVCAGLAYAGYQFTALEALHGRPLFGSVPAWAGPVVIPLGFGLIAMHYCFRVVEATAALMGRHELPEDILEVTLQ